MNKIMINKTLDIKRIKDTVNDRLSYILFAATFITGLGLSLLIQYDHDVFLVMVPATAHEALVLSIYFALIGSVIVLIPFLAGFSVIGKPILLLNLLFCGIIVGFMVLQYTIQCNDRGSLFLLFVFVPASIIAEIALICASTQSTFLCSDLYNYVIRSDIKKINIRSYLERYILIFGLMGISVIYLAVSALLFICLI